MFGWLKSKKSNPTQLSSDAEGSVQVFLDTPLGKLANAYVGPAARLLGLAQAIAMHCEDIRQGTRSYPAVKRENPTVYDVWEDTRLEALSLLWNFGMSEPGILADTHRQLPVLNELLDGKPHLKLPQPFGEALADTIQAVGRVYGHLSETGTLVGDPGTDQIALRIQKRHILTDLVSKAEILRDDWTRYVAAIDSSSELPPTPMTLSDVLYEDVTAKSKSIALASVWGPDWVKLYNQVTAKSRQVMIDEGKTNAEVIEFDAKCEGLFRRMQNAKSPDDLLKS